MAKYILALVIFMTPFLLYGKTKEGCTEIAAIKQLADCALKNHPELRVFMAKRGQKQALEDIAEQIPNLELDTGLLADLQGGGFGGEVNLNHTFELGGKRSARVAKARAELSVYQKELLVKRQEVVVDALLRLYRYRQIEHEIETLEEAISTFSEVIRRYNKLARLSPEREASRNTFLFARQAHRISLRALKQESIGLRYALQKITGADSFDFSRLSPELIESWPDMQPLTRKQLKSPFIEVADQNYKLSKKTLSLMQANAWPDLSIGPSYEYGNGSHNVGGNFNITVPLYHQSQGERKHARKGIEVAKTRIDAVRTELYYLRRSLTEVYKNATSDLDIKSIFRLYRGKHRRLHRLAERGLVPAPLVIELHRQEIDLIRAYHRNELAALKALWQVYSIDGVIFKEVENAQ